MLARVEEHRLRHAGNVADIWLHRVCFHHQLEAFRIYALFVVRCGRVLRQADKTGFSGDVCRTL